MSLEPVTVVEELLYCVKRVEATLPGGKLSVGTGYLCMFEAGPTERIIFCVTNRHVVESALSIRILMHTSVGGSLKPDGGHTFLQLTGSILVPHPEKIDLCALMIGPALNEWTANEKGGRVPFFKTLGEAQIFGAKELAEMDALEPILMIGCPNAVWDDHHGFPLIRRGVTASPPGTDFQGRPEFAIDIGVYSGSSGSPVFLFDSGLIKANKRATAYSPGSRFGLIGTLWGGPRITEQGQIRVEPVPTSNQITAEVDVRMHLGYAIKSTETLRLFQEVRAQTGSVFNKPHSA